MIIHNVKQGSREWALLRCGIPTASEFSKIVTPGGKKGQPKPSEAQESYMRELIAEILMGRPAEGAQMPWMLRGNALEAEAVSFYELQNDAETTPVGFITNDEGTIGVSPDRMVGDHGLLETKVPAPHTHVGYLLFNDVDLKYKPQLQGQLLITGREWVDICSYHPEMPPAIVRVTRDEEFLKLLDEQLQAFVERLAVKKLELAELGMLPTPESDPPEFITQQDEEMILASIRQRETHGQSAIQ